MTCAVADVGAMLEVSPWRWGCAQHPQSLMKALPACYQLSYLRHLEQLENTVLDVFFPKNTNKTSDNGALMLRDHHGSIQKLRYISHPSWVKIN